MRKKIAKCNRMSTEVVLAGRWLLPVLMLVLVLEVVVVMFGLLLLLFSV